MKKPYSSTTMIITILLLSHVVLAAVGPSGGYSTPYSYPTPPNKCADVVCQQVSKACPDGFIDACSPSCDSSTGDCGTCTPSCTGHDKPRPETNLKCSELKTARERSKCRVNLPEENELNYLPEECRELTGISKARCVTTYQTVQQCFTLENDVARVSCAKKNLVLSRVADEKIKCANNSTCTEELKVKVFDLVKFRIYNLEYKAQELREKGVDESLVLDFITSAEEKKVEFNNAQTLEEKKQVVRDVIQLWTEFIKKAMEQVKS